MREKRNKDYFRPRRPKKTKGNHNGNRKPDGWYYERYCSMDYGPLLGHLEAHIGEPWAEIRSNLFSKITSNFYRYTLREALSRYVTEWHLVGKPTTHLCVGDLWVDENGLLQVVAPLPKIETLFQVKIKQFHYDDYDYELTEAGWIKGRVFRTLNQAWEKDWYSDKWSYFYDKKSLNADEMEALYKAWPFLARHDEQDDLISLWDAKDHFGFRYNRFIGRQVKKAFNLESLPWQVYGSVQWVNKHDWAKFLKLRKELEV